jgi:hypothetical protein
MVYAPNGRYRHPRSSRATTGNGGRPTRAGGCRQEHGRPIVSSWKAKESSIPRSLWRCQTGSDNEPKKRPERGEYEASEAEFTCRNMEPTRFIKFRIRRRFRANPMVAFLQGAMRKRRLPDWPRPLIPIGRGFLSQHRKFHIFERPNPG